MRIRYLGSRRCQFERYRLEFVSRIKLWRDLIDDPTYDADYWLTRLENLAEA